MLTEHIKLPDDTDFDVRDLYVKRTKDGRWQVQYDSLDMGRVVEPTKIVGYLGCSNWEVSTALEELRTRIRVYRALMSC